MSRWASDELMGISCKYDNVKKYIRLIIIVTFSLLYDDQFHWEQTFNEDFIVIRGILVGDQAFDDIREKLFFIRGPYLPLWFLTYHSITHKFFDVYYFVFIWWAERWKKLFAKQW